jgi:hypothetical protein
LFSLFLLSCFFISPILNAGERLTGNARYDLLNIAADSATVQTSVVTRPEVPEMHLKSPLAAAGMSLVIPGAGQAYTGSYWKAGIMVCAEIAAITFAVAYTKKGDNKTTEFQNYADEHWSAVRYAEWIKAYGTDYSPDAAAIASAITINPDVSLPPWQRVNFAQINAWEAQTKTEGFSHLLPAYGEQQYYELIGKYIQFKFGWDGYKDVFGWTGDVPNSDGKDYFRFPLQMNDYSTNRGKANNYYNTAAVAVWAVVINHVTSALEAFFSTRSDNMHIIKSDVSFRLDQQGAQAFVATDLTFRIQL